MERGHTHRQKRHQPDHDIHKSVAAVGTSLQIKGNPTLARHATHPSSPKGLTRMMGATYTAMQRWHKSVSEAAAPPCPREGGALQSSYGASPAACVMRVLPVQPPQ